MSPADNEKNEDPTAHPVDHRASGPQKRLKHDHIIVQSAQDLGMTSRVGASRALTFIVVNYTAMDTVNKVVDAGYKALWGEGAAQQQQQQQQHATATGSTDNQQSSFNSMVDAGKKAIWGDTSDQQKTPHGDEPVSGEQGLGTAMDPYDAGNREEEEAVPYPAGSNSHVTEQRNVETSQGASSGTATGAAATVAPEPDMLKTTVTGLKQDPSEPSKSVTDSASRVIVDTGPGQSLKHTSEPFQKESDELVQGLQGHPTQPETPKVTEIEEPAAGIPAPVPAPSPGPAPAPAAILDESASKTSKDDTGRGETSKSSFSGTSSDASGSEKKTKTSKLEKVKHKLHIGSGSPKAK
ncbi:hypothetical protein PISL3812_07705 [Talaromyces islandicus]|uniref:Uncharacterized protein n=1 Tax=Talaromyces islandicus TaxID=28573 RepID=A0A0U1M6H9_TALIS|nr:hypothetical protein PISL3812_07705 [Talaromyces islandicus]